MDVEDGHTGKCFAARGLNQEQEGAEPSYKQRSWNSVKTIKAQ